ncbi:ABC transporter permease [Pseudotabrizicola sp. 4114]|uniref:ABC transporter permease n=1 Tax=Pseudotabrizicola sp. 4114 TaxID=2817731 RepID=UPI0032B7407D
MKLEQNSVEDRSGKFRVWLESYGAFIALNIACAAFALADPGTFLTPTNLRTILDQSAVPVIIVCGLTFVILIGSIDLSTEGVLAASSLTFVLLSSNSRNAIDLGIGAFWVALGVGALFGLLSGLLQTRLRIPSFMVSLGLWFIGLGVGTVLYGSDVPVLTSEESRNWVSASNLGVSNAVLLAAFMVAVSWIISGYTRMGRFAYAIGTNEAIARLNSIPVGRYKVLIFVYAGFCISVAAIIASCRLGVGTPDVGSGQLFLTTAAVIVGGTPLSGGRGGILQSVCGVFLLIVISNGLILIGASPITQQAMSGLIIVTAVVLTGYRQRDLLRVVK